MSEHRDKGLPTPDPVHIGCGELVRARATGATEMPQVKPIWQR